MFFDGSITVMCYFWANSIWLTGICWFATALLTLFCTVYFIANCMKLGMFIMWLLEMTWFAYIIYVIYIAFEQAGKHSSQHFWWGVGTGYAFLLYPQACVIGYCFGSCRQMPSWSYVVQK